jgi:hypothetical protein
MHRRGQGLLQGPHHVGDRTRRLASAAMPQEGLGHRQADRAGADRELPAAQPGGLGPQPGRGGLGDMAVPGTDQQRLSQVVGTRPGARASTSTEQPTRR